MSVIRLLFRGVAVLALLMTASSGNALAAQSVRLQAAFSPERLGEPTTVFFGFQISSIAPEGPTPLTGVSVLLPGEMGFATSGLGLENCVVSRLEQQGPRGCPADALMGRGTAIAEIPLGGETVVESAQIEMFSAPVRDGRLALSVYANAEVPVNAQLVFPAMIVPASSPYSEGIDTNVPLVPSLPGAADVAVTSFHVALGTTGAGPDSFVYYKSVPRGRVAYAPAGLLLPPSCPHGGFPFAAQFTFQNGTAATAQTNVPCPHQPDRPRR